MTSTDLYLDRGEWQAVAIALKDAERCGCGDAARPGRFGRFVRWFTGDAPANPLADPRLEAIRGFVCASRRTRRPAERLAPALAAQGWNGRQIEALARLAM